MVSFFFFRARGGWEKERQRRATEKNCGPPSVFFSESVKKTRQRDGKRERERGERERERELGVGERAEREGESGERQRERAEMKKCS